LRILIVSKYFPPKNTICALRLYSFAKYWHRAGHDISVLTVLNNTSKNDLNLDCSSFNIIRLAMPFFRLTASYNSVSNPDKKSSKFSLSPIKILFKLFILFREKTGCFSTHFPDFSDIWAKKAVKLVDADNYDIVLSSGGPYSVHRVGLALKKKNPKIKWIVDWRDLWTKDPMVKGFPLFIPYEIYLERKFHKNADLITTISDPLKKTLESITSTPVKTIYNGFDPDDFIDIQKKDREINNVFKIVYTGSFYRKLQDPSPLFAAVSQIKMKYPLLYGKIQIQFAGLNSDVSDIAKKYDISDSFNYLGFVNYETSLSLQYNADTALFIDYNNTEGILSGKIFEYINVSRNIIVIGGNESSCAVELIKKTNTGVFLGKDVFLIEQFLVRYITAEEKIVNNKNALLIREYTRENQAKLLLNYVLQSDYKPDNRISSKNIRTTNENIN